MTRRRDKTEQPHRYVPGPSLYTRGTTVIVRHLPGCKCGWKADTEYADADVARAAWALHKEQS